MRKKINDKQQLFIEAYLVCLNASEAARRAGYKSAANVHGSRLLANVNIRSQIDERLKEKGMGADEILARLATMARGSLSVFVKKNGEIDLDSDEAREQFYLLKKARVKKGVTKSGEPWEEREIELHDPQAALVNLGRYWSLFTDKHQMVLTWDKAAQKMRELGYNPDEILQQTASSIAEMGLGGDAGRSLGTTTTEQGEDLPE